jgi:hypothetical protein
VSNSIVTDQIVRQQEEIIALKERIKDLERQLSDLLLLDPKTILEGDLYKAYMMGWCRCETSDYLKARRGKC